MRAVFSDAAVEDLESIERYILSYRNEPFLERFEEGLAALVRSIAERPWSRPVYQFPPGAEPTMEYRSANTYNYKVFYRVVEPSDTVIVYRILHVRSDFTRVF